MNILNVENLSKKFSDEYVLNNISFTLKKGESLYIVGENGSGKTTLVKLLLGLLHSTSGSIEFEGVKRHQIGYLPQQNEIQSDFPATAKEIIMSGFLNNVPFCFYTKKQKEKAISVAEKLHIANILDKSFPELSGGQKQRVLLARALCSAGEILLLDEPMTALDPLASAEFYALLEQLKKDGVTLIIISHDVECAVKYGDKILHLGKNETFFGLSHEYCHSELGKTMLSKGHHHD